MKKVKPTNEQVWKQATTAHPSGRAQPPTKPSEPDRNNLKARRKRERANRKKKR